MANKVGITLPEDMFQALQKIAEDEDKVISYIVRRALAEYLLRNYGITVQHKMDWGGKRGPQDEE
jgi:predicted transcriptional regulator